MHTAVTIHSTVADIVQYAPEVRFDVTLPGLNLGNEECALLFMKSRVSPWNRAQHTKLSCNIFHNHDDPYVMNGLSHNQNTDTPPVTAVITLNALAVFQ